MWRGWSSHPENASALTLSAQLDRFAEARKLRLEPAACADEIGH